MKCIIAVNAQLGANGRNNSQHCWTNTSGSCCLRVGSGVQTDAKEQAATCNRGGKRAQYVTSNNVASVCVGLYIVWRPHFYLSKAWRSDRKIN